jgi:cysteine sulfinate desulfinase/cysteine desulfurase-like protein
MADAPIHSSIGSGHQSETGKGAGFIYVSRKINLTPYFNLGIISTNKPDTSAVSKKRVS